MKWKERILLSIGIMSCLLFGSYTSVYADGVGDTGGTEQGDIGGTNVYTFSYIYDKSKDAIELKVTTKYPLSCFDNTNCHIYTSPSDDLVLNTKHPILGNSIENAIETMNSVGGYKLSVSDVKASLNDLGYYDKGNGIWEYSTGYLTYVSAVKIRPQVHTIHYNANGGSGAPGNQTKTQGQKLLLSSKKPTRTGYTFQYWTASIGGNYNSGQKYTHDQNGGTVTMKAYWKDETDPDCSDFVAKPNEWSAGNGTVAFKARDKGSGLASITLQRYSYVTRTWSTVKTWPYSGTTDSVSGSYTETSEGVFHFKLTIKDKAGNTTTMTSEAIYLDHSDPVLNSNVTTVTNWTNIAPVISYSATDYLSGTAYGGSGVVSVVIKDDSGNVVARGTSSVRYTVTSKYEGIHTWYITATDNVGHAQSNSVTTKYDITGPGVDGTEITYVQNEITVSGYCQDNIINQHIDDEASRSVNRPNCTSGLKSVILYRVKDGVKTAITSATTRKTYTASDTHSSFDMYYAINQTEDNVDYYLINVQDYAGNMVTKKLTSQRSLLRWFHTSIDRSTYE